MKKKIVTKKPSKTQVKIRKIMKGKDVLRAPYAHDLTNPFEAARFSEKETLEVQALTEKIIECWNNNDLHRMSQNFETIEKVISTEKDPRKLAAAFTYVIKFTFDSMMKTDNTDSVVKTLLQGLKK